MRNNCIAVPARRPLFRSISPYVCPACRQNSSQSLQPLRKRTSADTESDGYQTTERRSSIAHRSFHSSKLRLQQKETSDRNVGAFETASNAWEEQFVKGRVGETPDITNRQNIRDQLRAWSEEDRKSREARTSGASAANIQPRSIPNSLFSGEADEEEEAEDLDFGQDEPDFDPDREGDPVIHLDPGDVLRLSMPHARNQFAIFVGMSDTQGQFLLADGRWTVFRVRAQNTLTFPNFATPEELTLLRSYFPSEPLLKPSENSAALQSYDAIGDLPRVLAEPFMRRLNTLQDDELSFRRDHIQILDRLYDKISHETNYNVFDLSDVTERLIDKKLDELSPGARFAIFQALRNDESKHQIHRSRGGRQLTVIVTPRRLWEQFEKVKEWAREYQDTAALAAVGNDVTSILRENPLSKFITKARRLILKSRKIRSPTTIGILGPSNNKAHDDDVTVVDNGDVFSPEDMMIIEFMWNTYLKLPEQLGQGKNRSIASLVLRAVGAYPTLRLDEKIGRLFLQEIGSRAPWSEQSDEDVLLPIPGRRGAQVADRLKEESDRTSQEMGLQDPSTKLPLPDSMVSFRQDWGDTEVFCIDKPTTELLDDAISIEKALDVPGAYWIHVHVAHVSAYLTPEHPFARRAEHFGASVYTSSQIYDMLPRDFTRRLSLQPGSSVLTTSTLITEDGEVKDVKVTAGIIRKVMKLDSAAVELILGLRKRDRATLHVGGSSGEPKRFQSRHNYVAPAMPIQDATPYADFIHQLSSLCTARMMKREKEVPVAPRWQQSVHDIELRVSYKEQYDAKRLTRSLHYLGDPHIQISANRYFEKRSYSQNLLEFPVTAKAMLLACESTGRWLRERQIPALFIGSLPQPDFPISRLNESGHDGLTSMPLPVMSATPVPHVMLNVSQYARVTSPLRRYTDILSQWQMDAYLRLEAERSITGKSHPRPLLPITAELVNQWINRRGHLMAELDKLYERHQTHYMFQAMFRAFHFNEAPLPEVWDVQIKRIVPRPVFSEDSTLRAVAWPFRLNSIVLRSKEGWEKTATYHSWLPVKIEVVDLNTLKLHVRPVGPPSDEPTQKGPIRIEAERPPAAAAAKSKLSGGAPAGDQSALDDSAKKDRIRSG